MLHQQAHRHDQVTAVRAERRDADRPDPKVGGMTEPTPDALLCAVCARRAIAQARVSTDPDPLRLLPARPALELTKLAGNAWRVPIARAVFDGVNVCQHHLSEGVTVGRA
jgi:hypothetical protein